MKDKVLILNPGSTSTKIAVYCNDEIIHLESIQHSHEDLAPFAHVQDQKEYRLEKILNVLDNYFRSLEFDRSMYPYFINNHPTII